MSAITSRPVVSQAATIARTLRVRRRSAFGWLMAAPYLLLLFAIIPLGYAIFASTRPAGQLGDPAIVAVFSDFRFLPAATNVGTLLVLYLPAMVIGCVGLALVMDEQPARFGSTIRLVYMLPGIVTDAAAVVLWYMMLQPLTSPFAPALRAMGFETGGDIFQAPLLPAIFAVMAFATGFG